MRLQLRPVSHLSPFPDTIAAHAVIHSETKPGHHVSPHTSPSCRPKRTRYNDITNVTGISYENAKHRVSCVSPLTTAKLTRSCAGPNPGAITYTQLTTDISQEETETCKRLALEHHKTAQNVARNVGSQPRPPAKRQGTRERARACPGPGQRQSPGGPLPRPRGR